MTVKLFNMKKYSFAFIAVLFALVSAFSFKPAFDTFRFDGDSTDPDDRVNPDMYTLASPGCGSTEVSLCTIVAAKSGTKPVIDENDNTGLYEALWNDESTVEPDFSHASVTGKNP